MITIKEQESKLQEEFNLKFDKVNDRLIELEKN